MLDQNNTPPPPNIELKFQMQAMTKVGKHGKVAGTCTQYVRKVGAEPKSNNGSGLIMRILRRKLMILVMVVLRIRPQAIGKVFGSLKIEGISNNTIGNGDPHPTNIDSQT
jgi:hypothetical protein